MVTQATQAQLDEKTTWLRAQPMRRPFPKRQADRIEAIKKAGQGLFDSIVQPPVNYDPTTYEGFKDILCWQENGVGWVSFNRKSRSGRVIPSYSVQTLTELESAFTQLARMPNIYTGVLTGEGDRFFNTGGDLNEYRLLINAINPGLMGPWMDLYNKAHQAFENFDKPTIVALNGAAVGGGHEWVLKAGVVIMAKTADYMTFDAEELKKHGLSLQENSRLKTHFVVDSNGTRVTEIKPEEGRPIDVTFGVQIAGDKLLPLNSHYERVPTKHYLAQIGARNAAMAIGDAAQEIPLCSKGERIALEMLLWNERLDSTRCLDTGLVNWVVPYEELRLHTQLLAEHYAGHQWGYNAEGTIQFARTLRNALNGFLKPLAKSKLMDVQAHANAKMMMDSFGQGRTMDYASARAAEATGANMWNVNGAECMVCPNPAKDGDDYVCQNEFVPVEADFCPSCGFSMDVLPTPDATPAGGK